jgi:hypothetical protein
MEGILEKWYWHALYYNTWVDAHTAQTRIIRMYDEYCIVKQCEQGYMVLFSTNYPFTQEFCVDLYILLLGTNIAHPVFNESGSSFANIATAYDLIITYRMLIGIVLSVLLSSVAIGFCCYLLLHFLAWLEQMDCELAELKGEC